MAFAHIYVDQTKPHGAQLRNMLNQLENGRNQLLALVDCIVTMIDGDSAVAANYGEVASRFGFPDTTTAKAAFDELNSLKSKLATDADVTNVQAAMLQAFSKFR
jgi:hypothetical protein